MLRRTGFKVAARLLISGNHVLSILLSDFQQGCYIAKISLICYPRCMRRESIVLPLPALAEEIQQAASHFDQQYGIAPLLEIRGHITLQGHLICLLPGWRTIAKLDLELGLIGLGDPNEPEEEELLWILPSGPGELRLSAIVEV